MRLIRSSERRVVHAAVVLGGALLAVTAVDRPPRELRCDAPRALEAPGAPVHVRCASPGRSNGGAADRVSGPAGLLFGLPLDLNAASELSLQVLPGVGPSRARTIAAARASSTFASVEDLVRVRGIGARTVAGLRGWVAVSELPAEGARIPAESEVRARGSTAR